MIYQSTLRVFFPHQVYRHKGCLSNDDGEDNRNGIKQQLCTCITLFWTFLCRHCTTKKWKRLILSFVEDVNTRRLSFPFPEIRYSLLEFNSTKKANIWKARWSLKQRDYPFKWCFRSRRRCRTVTSLITQTQRHSLAKNVLTPNAWSDLNSTEWPGFDITRHSFSITTNCCKSADAHLYYTPLICSRIILFHNIDWRLQISKTSQDVHYFCKANTRLGSTVMHQITTLRPQMIPFCLIY